MAKQGRPRGLNINPFAIEDMLDKACISKAELAASAGITPSHLSDMLHRQKGAGREVIRLMATALRCRPETIAPELAPGFVVVRIGDEQPAGAVA